MCSVLRTNFTKQCNKVLINCIECKSLIDTASDLSLLQIDSLEKLALHYSKGGVTRFRGIGSEVFYCQPWERQMLICK